MSIMSSFDVNDCLDATRYAGYQRLAVLLGDFSDPNVLDCLPQVLSAWLLLVCHLILFIIVHSFSIGLRSGLFPGHSRTEILILFMNSVASFCWCQGAPSCTKIVQPWTCMCSLRFSLSNSTCLGPFIVEGRKEIFYLTTHSTHFYLRLYGVYGKGPFR